MIAEKPSWVRHEGMQIFSIDVQPGGLRFATGGGDHKVWNFFLSLRLKFVDNFEFWAFSYMVFRKWHPNLI